MPVREIDTGIHHYKMSRMGVNIYKNLIELHQEECVQAQNAIWENGMVKRGGQSLLTSTEVVTSKKILGLHRFYKSDGTKQLIAVSDTLAKYYVGPGWTSLGITQTTGKQTYMTTWGPLDKVYITNGTDVMKSWTGAAQASITIADGVPTQALPYQDRLLTIIGGDLTWSASFDDTGANWETIANCGVRPDTKLYGMTYHSVTSSSAGYETKVLLAGTTGMYLFAATDLRVPYTTGDYTIYPLAITVGCNAPRTMVWTPKGTLWLGIDKQIYLLPFGSVTPVPVGTKIQSNTPFIEGIETIPETEMENAAAVYHNGFYKLSVARSGQTANNVQWWLDIERLYQDEDGQWGSWYGPMLGQTISCYVAQNGAGDDGELMAGEASAKGYVYQVGNRDVWGDVDPTDASAKAIQVYWKSFYHPLGNDAVRKDVHKAEFVLLESSGTINIEFHDIDTVLKSNDNFSLGDVFWDDFYWDEEYWSGRNPVRQQVHISPAIQPRRLAIVVEHTNETDVFELQGVKVAATEQNQVFE